MTQQNLENQIVIDDFNRAVRVGRWRHLLGHFRAKGNALLCYDEATKRQQLAGQHDLGTQTIRIDQIVGSMGRCDEFDRAFYPRQTFTSRRWMSVDRAAHQDIALPAVELLKIGDQYFVKDGHHRISVARAHKQVFIDAHIVEVEMDKN
jgi:hypothetical protein